MKGKRIIFKAISFALALVIFTMPISCGKKDLGNVTVENPALEGSEVFHAGIWEASVMGEVTEYYFFNDDGTSGNTQNVEMGTGVAFDFEVDSDSGKVTFHMGAADDNTEANYKAETVVDDDTYSATVTLNWTDGRDATVLKFLYDSNAEFDGFYSNNDLEIMARNCYTDTHKNNKDMPGMVGIQSLENGMVAIQLYDNLGDHNSTAAWYEVNRFTGEGKDTVSGDEIDFNQYYSVN